METGNVDSLRHPRRHVRRETASSPSLGAHHRHRRETDRSLKMIKTSRQRLNAGFPRIHHRPQISVSDDSTSRTHTRSPYTDRQHVQPLIPLLARSRRQRDHDPPTASSVESPSDPGAERAPHHKRKSSTSPASVTPAVDKRARHLRSWQRGFVPQGVPLCDLSRRRAPDWSAGETRNEGTGNAQRS